MDIRNENTFIHVTNAKTNFSFAIFAQHYFTNTLSDLCSFNIKVVGTSDGCNDTTSNSGELVTTARNNLLEE